MIRHAYDYIKKHPSLWLLIIPAFLLHMLIMFPSGTTMCLVGKCGVHFWGIHSHDSMWHLEIAETAFRSFPFRVPTFAGANLTGYNILMDFIIYLISFLGIPPIITLFKIIPIVWFFFYTVMGITLSRKMRDSVWFVFITLFLLYFADSFGYFIQLYHEGSILKGSQSFYLQSLTTLLNTQFALTLPLIMWQLVLIVDKKYTLKTAFLMGVLSSIAISLKFYGGVISLVLSGGYLLDLLIKEKRLKNVIMYGSIIASLTIISVIVFYNPFAANKTGSIFTFSPFSTVHSMIEAADMVHMPDMVNARYFLYEHGVSLKLIYIELLTTLLYFFFNFGTRIFGVIYLIWKIIKRQASRFEIYVLTAALVGFILNVCLIQKGDWWNTVQFGYYGVFLTNFLLAITLFDLLSKRNKIGVTIAIMIILLTIPGNLKAIIGFTDTRTLYISSAEIEAMNYLKKLPDGVVFNSFQAPNGYTFMDYRTSGYVSAFTGKQLYLAHLGPLNIIGVDYKKREARVISNYCSVLNDVSYIYYVKGHDDTFLKVCSSHISQQFTQGFSNDTATVYQKK